ncbi:MAG: hypothetical protein H6Q67_472 [Firmicutes bacterium]|nr:hypothetical protein [Bacillota bacterium]
MSMFCADIAMPEADTFKRLMNFVRLDMKFRRMLLYYK